MPRVRRLEHAWSRPSSASRRAPSGRPSAPAPPVWPAPPVASRRHRRRGPAAPAASGIDELDRVLGGGLVPGSLVLVGGEPGIGKSTLLLQAAAGLTRGGLGVLYATGEESAGAGAPPRRPGSGSWRARPPTGSVSWPSTTSGGSSRLPAPNGRRSSSSTRSRRPPSTSWTGAAGSVGQVRESTLRLMELAKGDGIAVILVGPRDQGRLDRRAEDPRAPRRRRPQRSRASGTRPCGSSGRPRTGSARPTRSASSRWPRPACARSPIRPARSSPTTAGSAPGSVVAPTLEGSRPLLVEVQALVSPTGYGTPSRKASGLDPNRLSLLIAVLGRRAGIALGSHDVYANLAGGLSVDEPALDLPRRPRARVVARATARSRPGQWPSARSVCSASCGPWSGSSVGSARPRVLASAGRSCRACPPAGPCRRSRGLEVAVVGSLRDAIDVALSDRPALVARHFPRC